MNHHALRHANVLIVHPDPILCCGLLAALRPHTTFEVSVHSADSPRPERPWADVVIADYGNAMRLTDAQFRRTSGILGHPKILALTSNDREADIRRAIEAGVSGYLLVGGPLHELVEALTAVAGGVRYLSPSVAQRVAASLAHAALTSREAEVLRLAATGQSNKAIARQLEIGLGTVKSHMSAIMAKLGASCRTQAASIAASRGLVNDHVEARRAMAPALELA